jgi:hypothetical protein
MRDFYFYTSRPLTAQECYDNLKSEIMHIEMNGETDIWINYNKSRSFLWFYNEKMADFIYESKEDFEKQKNQIPIQDPFVNHFETHRSIDAKRVIKVLMTIYPELYVFKDDDAPWQGTAQEFLDTEFDF